MIIQLRERYRDLVHPLSRLEIFFPGAKVRLEYLDLSRQDKKGAFRVHPRLPALQIWPDMESGERLLRSMGRTEEEFLNRIRIQEQLREAREAIMQARARGRPPSQEDWKLVQETRLRPLKPGRSSNTELEGRVLKLKEIESAVVQERRDLLRMRGVLPTEAVEIPLKPDAPTMLRPSIQVKLRVQFL
ncbi:MAG: hypothetical protein JSV18_01660 [Candidatus Bathyarchaeota archaeon]|nr:MAG: hypothetical protein JSV18_01660 [Candidatus Bathyarchaeota archaeon]